MENRNSFPYTVVIFPYPIKSMKLVYYVCQIFPLNSPSQYKPFMIALLKDNLGFFYLIENYFD